MTGKESREKEVDHGISVTWLDVMAIWCGDSWVIRHELRTVPIRGGGWMGFLF
jgi:hypothetical protein